MKMYEGTVDEFRKAGLIPVGNEASIQLIASAPPVAKKDGAKAKIQKTAKNVWTPERCAKQSEIAKSLGLGKGRTPMTDDYKLDIMETLEKHKITRESGTFAEIASSLNVLGKRTFMGNKFDAHSANTLFNKYLEL